MITNFKIGALLLLFFLGSLSTAVAQPYGSERQKKSIENSLTQAKISKIFKVINEQLVAWNQGDMNGYMQGYWNSDSLQFITSKGVTLGYQQVLSNYVKSYPTKEKMGNLSFENLTAKFLDPLEQVAQVTGKWKVLHEDKTSEGTFSLIVKFFGTEPRIIIDHTF
jgi:hypothetical protein